MTVCKDLCVSVCKFANETEQKKEACNASAHSLAVHIIFTLFLIKFTFFLCGGVLVLLVFANQVIHIAFRLCEFHFVHSLASVPMQECLAAEHGREIFSDTLEHLLDSCRVAQEGHRHFQALWWDITDPCLDVVWNPFHKVGRVLVLHVQHLLVNFLGRHTSTEQSSSSQVASVTRISGAHHVLSVKHLLSQLRNSQSTVLLRTTRSQRSETSHEEVQTREWNHVNSDLTQVAVQLTWETYAAGNSGHSSRHQVVQVTISRSGELQGTEADIVKSFVIHHHDFISILDKLV